MAPTPKRPLASAPKDEPAKVPAELASPDVAAVEPAVVKEPAPAALVKGRWVGAEACFNPEQGYIEPGDEIEVTREQLDDPNTPVIPLDKPWTRPDTQGSER